jgi:hypothetical protein
VMISPRKTRSNSARGAFTDNNLAGKQRNPI